MKFHIKKIILWFKNDSKPRELVFKPNKVNVITGGSGTGKTSLLSILDYCMLSTKANITEEIINENVLWYGLDFKINDKDFVIIRKHPINNIGSKEIYFSSDGTIPNTPEQNNDIKSVKTALEQEFGIDENLKIPFGGKYITGGSKISYRYFLLFNTLSEDTIAHTNTFFDYHLYERDKYIEALARIFYLAIGVDDVENVLAKERIDKLERELLKIEKKKKAIDKEEKLFGEKIIELVGKAQEYDLIERKLFTIEEGEKRLSNLINDFKTANYSSNMQMVDDLNKNKRSLFRKLRNLERFDSEYIDYKKNLRNNYDSLRPIEYLQENFNELIPTIELKTFLSTLEASLRNIKTEVSKRKTLSTNVKSEISVIRKKVQNIDAELSKLPTTTKDYKDEAQKFIFIGELKSQLDFYKDKWNIDDEISDTSNISVEIDELKKIISNTNDKRRIIINELESKIQRYFDLSESMGVYQNYKVFFDTKEKNLKVRKPKEQLAQQTIGSKSNYMFLHLFMFLGLHEHFIDIEQSYIPQFLVLDQPSQPYYEGIKENEELTKDDDKGKLQDAFSLINSFINIINKEYETDFQIILLEHAPQKYWTEKKLENFHLVEKFRDGNALIPPSAMIEPDESA
ncbi:DUF3732 domain-containing protein [Halosquirtibacter laminarini]|uniref:DUF3732 domain-containing protein n=1 Tax=Halosquirtibacter laminarini TaxID=3374600 RepID=A0AC61NQ04_9BACT|nr:DUF3732 domain-containing protein [Prolixibacteraceae bacterium]